MFGFFEPPRNAHPYSFEFYLYLPDGEQELVDPGEDLHEVLSEDEVEGPRDGHFEREIAPVVSVVVVGFADHLPLLHLGLAVEILDVGEDADAGSVHFQVEVARESDLIDFEAILFLAFIRIHGAY